MDKKVDQKIELAFGCDYKKLMLEVQRITEEKNKEGYELTCMDAQTNNANTMASSLAILVYTKK